MAIFKEFTDKSSVLNRISRYVQGGKSDIRKKKVGWWERRTDIKNDKATDELFTIEAKHEGRPDLISFDMYGTWRYSWLVLQYNNIVDINEELISGKTLILPSNARVVREIAIKTIDRRAVNDVNTI